MMRQRFLPRFDFDMALRDMRKNRTDEELLAAETLQAIKDADKTLGILGIGTADDLRRRLYDLTCKLEARRHAA